MMLCQGLRGREELGGAPHRWGAAPEGRQGEQVGGEEVINECPITALPLKGGHRGAWGWPWWPGLVVLMQRSSPCSGAAGGELSSCF